jgi:hypothetical protein
MEHLAVDLQLGDKRLAGASINLGRYANFQ